MIILIKQIITNCETYKVSQLNRQMPSKNMYISNNYGQNPRQKKVALNGGKGGRTSPCRNPKSEMLIMEAIIGPEIIIKILEVDNDIVLMQHWILYFQNG